MAFHHSRLEKYWRQVLPSPILCWWHQVRSLVLLASHTFSSSHIAIRSLQSLLLKISLLLGVKFVPGIGFAEVQELPEGTSVRDPLDRKFLWKMNVAPATKERLLVPYSNEDLYINVLVGADGENSAVAKELDFERKILQVRKTATHYPR